MASCADNGNTYPVGPTNSPYNTFPANTTEIVWNPWQWQNMPNQPPFAQATYTLQVWDERGTDAVRKGGYFYMYSGTRFGMYLPAAYTPLASEYPEECATSTAARQRESGSRGECARGPA